MRKLGERILKKLNDAGYEAYFAGGCVRDEVLGLEPKDYDITTSAKPDQVEALFHRTVPTGKDYGTITVLMEDQAFEVTTFRLESDYDGRRPKVVCFGSSLEADLARRDFTMNAMAMGLDGVLIDPFDGRLDLEKNIIRFVGLPEDRIREDRLRVLRYVRFMASYHLTGDTDCLNKVDIKGLSSERIRDELNKILISKGAADALRLMVQHKLLEQFAPELMPMVGFNQCNPNHEETVFEHSLTVLTATPDLLELRLAALFHDLGKPATFTKDENGRGHFYGHQKVSTELTRAIMMRLKYSKKQIEMVSALVEHHMRVYEHVTEVSAKRLIQVVGSEVLPLLFKLQLADTQACFGNREAHVKAIREMAHLCQQVLTQKMPLKVTDLEISGHHLMELGLAGRDIGTMLDQLLDEVVEGRLENSFERLHEWAINVGHQ